MEDILKFCIERGILLDKEVLDSLKTLDPEIVKEILTKLDLKKKIITKAFFNNNASKLKQVYSELDSEKKQNVKQFFINFGISLKIENKIVINQNQESFLKIIKNYPDEKKEISVGDFTKYYRNRYTLLKNILQNRSDLTNLSSINKLGGKRQNVSIIGIVTDKRVTQNKNLLLEVEDLTGTMRVLINNNKKEVFEKSKDILLDDVIGFRGSGNQEILFVNDLVYPDSSIPEKKYLSVDERVAFISDLHVGSENFLEKNLLKFIKWINGKSGSEEQRKEAKKIKYLFISGDSVDGVGIFPGQESQLNIKDLKSQYDVLSNFLNKIRKDIKIVICPGQHDGVRVAEPQPQISEKYAQGLYEMDNVFLVSNPSRVAISDGRKDFNFLIYHGASMNSTSSEMESLRSNDIHDFPAKVVKKLLKRRMISGMHSGGGVVYVPTKEDPFVISEVPDVIVTGDWHRSEVEMYNNILIIANSCWQTITPFEEKVGNDPDYCKVPVLNLKTRELKIMDFYDGEEENAD